MPPLGPPIWKACAGTAVQIPAAGSTVFYFPQGHAEHASSPPDFSSIRHRKPLYRCRIASVSLLADSNTDVVYAKIVLDPGPPSETAGVAAAADQDDVVAFPKVLTPSDANNGGGFSVPRYCAESIFPKLDYTADPPLQNVSIRDVHGTVWGFRHIFRGTPRRHLLTTGWSRFVNSKKLVAGDSVVFIKDGAGEMMLGIRRGRRSLKGRVPAESVVEAVRMAEMGRRFEVVYYPRSGSPDFVVDAEVVERLTMVHWTVGMRVKMPVGAEDASTVTSLQGTVCGLVVSDPVLWPGSPWRMLQVTLDEKVVNNKRSINPWQVELATSAFHLQAPYPALKRLKYSPSEQANNVESNMYYPVTGYFGDLSSPLFSYNHSPAGMQGARQISCESNLTSLVHKNSDYLFSDRSNVSQGREKLNNVSTELSIGVSVGSNSESGSSSPRSQSHNSEFSGTIGTAVERKESVLKLFGTVIQVDQEEMKATLDFPCILSRGFGI